MKEKIKKEKKEKSKTRKIIEWIGFGIFAALIAGSCFFLIYTKTMISKSSNPDAPIPIGNTYLPVIVKSSSMNPMYKKNDAIFITKRSPESIYQNYVKIMEDAQGKTGFDVTKDILIDLTFDDSFKDRDVNYNVDYVNGLGKTDRTTLYSTTIATYTHRLFYAEYHPEVEYGKGRYLFFVNGINDGGVSAKKSQFQILTENYLYGQVTGSSQFIGGLFTFVTSPWGLIVLLLIPSLYMVVSSLIDVFKASNEDELEETNVSNINNNPNDPLNGLSEKEKEKLKKQLLAKLTGKDKEDDD